VDCTPPAGRDPAETGQGTRIHVGGDDALHAAPRQYSRQHAGTGANVNSQRASFGQGRGGHQIDVFAAHRGKYAVMRVDARIQSRNGYAGLAPLVRTDQAQQFPQRSDERSLRRAVSLAASRMHVRRAT
jgi:hypothetical protein